MQKTNKLIFTLFFVASFISSSCFSDQKEFMELTQYVNPLMGTDSEFALSNGNTYPAIALPWGMNFWTPQTGKMGDGWAYTYDAYKIRGIKQTHQPSPWINDYGAFSLMPITGQLRFEEDDRASWFSHKAETAKPHYYQVYLADHDTKVEVAPTERAAHFKVQFPKTDSAWIILDGFHKGSMLTVVPAQNKIIGYARNNHGGVPDNFHNYFVAVFNKPFKRVKTWKDGEVIHNSVKVEGEHAMAAVGFKTKAGEEVEVQIASSFISPEQAEINLKRELGSKSFEQVTQEAQYAWNKELNRIQVEGNSIEDIKTFYSCLYRVLLFPRKFYEYDADSNLVHYSPYNGKILPGYMFTDNGFWDTFRSVFPFFTLMYPELNSQIMQGLVNTYKESGWLPEWASPGHRDCMIGSNSASIIADSYLKGIRGYDIELLYEAILKNTEQMGPVRSVGRYGADAYNQLGYIPYDIGVYQNAARTLEYAYADYCIWQLANELNKEQIEIAKFQGRAQNYKNLFDHEYQWMRGKNKDGSFQSPFNPLKWGDAFEEGNSIHYTWSVFHDIQGLIKLMGGNENFIHKLDTVFTMPPDFDHSYYGFTIHEIREMQIANMGNYAHGNQPIQHMPYLYNYAQAPSKTQEKVRLIMDKLYHSGPDGYCGDEDNGQTSAWYVFSALGFYPVCPGTDEYVFGSPLFKKATLYLENGNKFVIHAPKNSDTNIYVNNIKLNDTNYDFNFIKHEDILNGGELIYSMDNWSSKLRGTSPASAPYSMSNEIK